MSRAETTAGRALCLVLRSRGAGPAFGVPGTQTVPLYEALRADGFPTVLTTSELGATFAALGWARMTRRPGVAVVIPGPGFTMALTGLAEARHDSIPLVLLTGAPAAGHRFALQALDQAGIAASIVKAVLRADRASDVAGVVAGACDLAVSGEPGPVLVELPLDTLDDVVAAAEIPGPASPRVPEEGLQALVARLAASTRPVLLAGLGARGAADDLRILAERLGAPVATTVSGRGVLPESHRLALGIDPGTEGLGALNTILTGADLVLALGCKLSHNGTGGFRLILPSERLVHVDSSSAVLQGDYPASVSVECDVPSLVTALVASPLLRERPASAWTTEELDSARGAARAATDESSPAPVLTHPGAGDVQRFIAALRAAVPPDATLVTDSGLHQMMVRRHFPVLAPDGLIVPADFQSMGFGVPAALGAAMARPDRMTIALVGDGGLAMTGLELLAAARERIPLKVVVFTDGRLGLIHRQQVDSYGRGHAVDLGPFEPGAIAAAAGADYRILDHDLAGGLREWLTLPTAALLEVRLGPSASDRLDRLTGTARSAVRTALGPRLLALLRQLRK